MELNPIKLKTIEDSSRVNYEYVNDMESCYIALLSSARVLISIARNFAPCTGPEVECDELICKLNKMLFEKDNTNEKA